MPLGWGAGEWGPMAWGTGDDYPYAPIDISYVTCFVQGPYLLEGSSLTTFTGTAGSSVPVLTAEGSSTTTYLVEGTP